MNPTTPAITARSFEGAVRAAIETASTGASVLLVHADIAVQVDPGDDEDTIVANYDATAAAVLARLSALPLLSDGVRDVKPGDLVETQTDDHYTRIGRGVFGMVTNVGEHGDLTVRFARRSVDYTVEDHPRLRFAR